MTKLISGQFFAPETEFPLVAALDDAGRLIELHTEQFTAYLAGCGRWRLVSRAIQEEKDSPNA